MIVKSVLSSLGPLLLDSRRERALFNLEVHDHEEVFQGRAREVFEAGEREAPEGVRVARSVVVDESEEPSGLLSLVSLLSSP